jgi:tRNA-(ms[2]io[6]A)-hydroxylase
MLGLLMPTDPAWVEVAEGHLDQLLSDHAHCELKAAQSALSLLGRYAGEVPALLPSLTALACEETQHFAQVEQRLRSRGVALELPSTDQYVSEVRAAAGRTRKHDQPALLDRLLVAALIEGRSCERFSLLSRHLSDCDLRAFYRDLMASEARHFTLFSTLAADCFGADESRRRFAELAHCEAVICEGLPLGPTVHG